MLRQLRSDIYVLCLHEDVFISGLGEEVLEAACHVLLLCHFLLQTKPNVIRGIYNHINVDTETVSRQH